MQKIHTGNAFRLGERILVVGLGSESKARQRDGNPVLAPNGKATYSTGVKLLESGENGQVTLARATATVNVIEPQAMYGDSPISPTQYVTDGETWLVPYVSNGFVALSITCERLKEYDDLDELLGEAA